jgi:colanic acid/amylovoran biosynthesis glycosyltransferase
VSDGGRVRALVVSNAPPKSSETFISDHVRVLADGRLHVLRQPSGPGAILRGLQRRRAKESLTDKLRREHIDVVLAEYGPTAVAAMDSCEATGTPLIAHFHGFDVSKAAVLAAQRTAYPRLFSAAAKIVVVSGYMRQQLLVLGAEDSKIAVVPCGVDTVVFSGAQPGRADPRLLMVGRLVEKKQPVLVVRAFADALERVPDAVLTVIGDGPLMGTVVAEIERQGIARSVHLRGACTREVVRAEMLRSRAVVQHSRTATSGDMEGLPVSLMEAAACGLPVISTTHAGIPEVILHGGTGLLGAEGDVPAMSSSMITLLEDPGLAASLGSAAAAHARAHFDQTSMHARLRELMQTATQTP